MGRDSGENFHRASGGVVMYIIPFRFTPEVMAFITSIGLIVCSPSKGRRLSRKCAAPVYFGAEPPITPEPGAKNTAAQSLTAMRNKTLTPERRREIAVRAAKKRWESANA